MPLRTSDTATTLTRLAQLESVVQSLADRQQIIDVFRRYTRGLNRYDLELLTSAFWPDAQVNYGVKSRLRDEWISAWQQNYLNGGASQAHHITNETVDVSGDVAHVESYLIAFHRSKDDKPAMIRAGRYIDRFDRRNAEWRIAVREFIPHFWVEAKSIFDATFTEALWPRPSGAMGTQDKRDPCYWRPLSPRPRNDDRSN